MCLARRCLLPLLPPREERPGERRAVLLTGAPVCQQEVAPLPGPLPVCSSRGEGGAVRALNTYQSNQRPKRRQVTALQNMLGPPPCCLTKQPMEYAKIAINPAILSPRGTSWGEDRGEGKPRKKSRLSSALSSIRWREKSRRKEIHCAL